MSEPSCIASGLIMLSGIMPSISLHPSPISQTVAASLSGLSSWMTRMVASCPSSLYPAFETWSRLHILSTMSDSSLGTCNAGSGRATLPPP